MDNYKVVIGLEMHCQISKTKTKNFSSAKNEYSMVTNENVAPVDMGLPGTLPVVNKEAVRLSLMLSTILNCKQPKYLYFERKNYFYPDLPKGFQITQETKPAPIGIYGYLDYEVNGEIKRARINNLHLEEDSAGQDHFVSVSTIDYNRSGIPLLELVTEPDFHSADEAVAFLETVRSIYKYTGISEADSKKGQIRCDVNISIMEKDKDETNPLNFGTKVEIKNVNSFGAVREVINYEIKRQVALKETGEYNNMKQQTRRYDEEKQETKFMRDKDNAIDYKYFIEPNIPRFLITEKWLEEIKKDIPELANQRKEKYISKYKLKIEDADNLVKERNISDYFEELVKEGVDPIVAANWMNSVILGIINKLEISIDEFYIKPLELAKLLKLVICGKISRNQAKDALDEAILKNENPMVIVQNNGLEQISNDEEILSMVNDILNEHLKEIEDYNNGKTNAINFLLGQVMKMSKGKVNPAKAMELLKSEIEKRK